MQRANEPCINAKGKVSEPRLLADRLVGPAVAVEWHAILEAGAWGGSGAPGTLSALGRSRSVSSGDAANDPDRMPADLGTRWSGLSDLGIPTLRGLISEPALGATSEISSAFASWTVAPAP